MLNYQRVNNYTGRYEKHLVTFPRNLSLDIVPVKKRTSFEPKRGPDIPVPI